jgi:hypothetical protein
MSQSVINVEQFCAATASNTVHITLKTPKECQGPNETGTDIIAVDITQEAAAAQTCSNQSSFSALLNATIKNNLTASMAQSMAGVSLVGASLPSAVWEQDNVSTKAINSIIQTTDYSDLQRCRSTATNLISVYINDCKLNRDIGVPGQHTTYLQKATADLTNCVQNSNAMSSLVANVSNKETSSDKVTDPWAQMVATLGNVIMTCAVAAALAGVLIALIAAFAAVFKYHSQNIKAGEATKQAIAAGNATTEQMKIVADAANAKRDKT